MSRQRLSTALTTQWHSLWFDRSSVLAARLAIVAAVVVAASDRLCRSYAHRLRALHLGYAHTDACVAACAHDASDRSRCETLRVLLPECRCLMSKVSEKLATDTE